MRKGNKTPFLSAVAAAVPVLHQKSRQGEGKEQEMLVDGFTGVVLVAVAGNGGR